jgi:formate-dependent nitrite reductase cytochrome c552 subunit
MCEREEIIMKIRSPVIILSVAVALLLGGYMNPPAAYGFGQECAGCHATEVAEKANSGHSVIGCETCHEKAAQHLANNTVSPVVHFDMETCAQCHQDQYYSIKRDVPGKTYRGFDMAYSGGSLNPPTRWNKTKDMPFWNSLIDGHPFVIETYEDRAMCYNQLDARDTLRPMAEACLTCHGTAVAYYMGLNGVPGYSPGKVRTIKNTQTINSGNFEFYQGIAPIVIPAGTQVSTTLDTVNEPKHQVKTWVKLPDGRIYTSYTDPGATACGNDPANAAKRQEARNYVWSALQALAFDGMDPVVNKPSMDGMACNMCHNPRNGKLRIIQKPLIKAIYDRGVNPYERNQFKTFADAPKQDKLIALCGQCHSEYVGGYSAVDHIDRFHFPWAKPEDRPESEFGAPIPGGKIIEGVESQNHRLFGYNQDWKHGVGVRPWQTSNKNKPGYFVAGHKFPIKETLTKVQHPEAEALWSSPMYWAGASCIDCHTVKKTNPITNKQYTSHFFASPIKYINTDKQAPCAKCHTNWSNAFIKFNIYDLQMTFFWFQEEVQSGLVTSLKYIKSLAPGPVRDAALQVHRLAHLTWEFWVQGENSMGFHNDVDGFQAIWDTQTALRNACGLPMPPVRLLVDVLPPMPPEPGDPPGRLVGLVFSDTALNETHFVVERKTPGSAWQFLAEIPTTTPDGDIGDVAYEDFVPDVPGAVYYYRAKARIKTPEGNKDSTYTLPVKGKVF